jgi:nucleolin
MEEAKEEQAAVQSSRKRKAEEESEPAKENKKPNSEDDNTPVSVRFSNLAWSVTNESLAAYIAEVGVTPSNVRIIMDRETGRSKGFAFGDFDSKADAQKAIEAFHEQDLEGRPCRAEFAQGSPTQRSGTSANGPKKFLSDKPKGEPTSTLFVGNMSFNSNEDSLFSAFADYGKVISVRIPTDKESGRMKGFAYVEFSSVEDAQTALKSLDGAPIDGRAVRLDFAGARSTDGGNSGGSRGFSAGRGRGGNRGRGFRGDRGGRGGQRVGSAAKGSIQQFSGQKMTFDD